MKTPERLRESSGIGEKRALQITQSWKEQREVAHLMAFLQERGISPALALIKIYRHYGAESVSVLHRQPIPTRSMSSGGSDFRRQME